MVRSKVPFEAVKGVSPQALAVLHAQGFHHATPVQAAVIPLFSGHKDVAVDAATGSGKTLAFVLPLVEKLRGLEEPLQPQQLGAVIVSPTRELAKQIHAVAAPFLATLPDVSSLLLVGGTDPAEDVARFKQAGGQVLIGTPGRLSDFMKRCTALDARRLEVLVLDEADRLLDMGFREQLDAIMVRLPRQRRTGLFSATQTEAVGALARAGLRNPVRVNVAVTQAGDPAAAGDRHGGGTGGGSGDGEAAGAPGAGLAAAGGGQRTPSSLDIAYLVCDSTEKLGQLVAFLQAHPDEKSIVYFLTCACVDLFASLLARLAGSDNQPPPVCALHGRMKQAAREATLASFAALPAGCLLATDVAARGLDIPDVGWVLQFDAPQEPDAFVHRCGRTARMGRRGSALSFLLPHETSYVDFLRLRRVPMREEAPFPAPGPEVAHLPRQAGEADREVLEKGVRAFVSYVRGYKEHQARFIFRLADLDLGRLAMAMGLLRVPRMPEIKHASVALRSFTPSPVDPDTVKFADQAREKQRQKALKAKARSAAAQEAQQQDGGSRKQQQQRAAEAERKRLPAAKRRLIESRADADDMSGDYALLRKVKKGKITEEDYDMATGATEDATAEVEQRPQQQPAEQRSGRKQTKKARKAAKRRAKGSN